MGKSRMSSEDIIAMLARYRQRATYGALAGIVGGLPRSVMSGLPRTPENSWVVAAATGLPTGYGTHERHAELQSRDNVIKTADELLAWLRSPH